MNMRMHLRVAVSFILTLCAAFLIPVPTAQSGSLSASGVAPAPDIAAIDSYVAGQVRELRVPGLALGIVHDDQVVHLQSFGAGNPDGAAITPQTPFMLGSTTKSFTALAIMQLVEAGKVQLDAPLQTYLPWFRVADSTASARITVRTLLNHTSGLPTGSDADQLDPDTSAGALETSVRRLSSIQLDGPVGTKYEYSNSNYETLGLIVQVVSGQPYETYVQEHIFAPLDMTHSYASKGDAEKHGLATGYRYWFGFPVLAPNLPYNRSMVPGGLLISTAEDMSHYLIAQLNDGVYAGRRLLSADGMRLMHTPAVTMDATLSYAMGWMVGKPDGVPVVTHGGDLAEYHSDMILIPSGEWGRWGVVVLTNVNSTIAPVAQNLWGISWGVAGRIVGRPWPTAPQPPIMQYWVPVGFGTVLLLLMAARMIWSARNIRLWRRQRSVGPVQGRAWAWRVGVPLLVDAFPVAFFLFVLPHMTPGSLANLERWQPDMFWLQCLSLLVAVIWGPVRTLFTVLALRARPHAPALKAHRPAPAPAH